METPVLLIRARATIVLAVLVIAGSYTTAHALPMFGRATNLACAKCHVAGSRLTPAGMAFDLRGDHMWSAHDDSLIHTYTVHLSLVAAAGSTEAWPTTPTRAAITPSERGTGSVELHTLMRFGKMGSMRLSGRVDRADKGMTSHVAYLQIGESPGRSALSLKVGVFDAELPFFSPRLRPTYIANLAPQEAELTGVTLGARSGGWAGGVGLVDSERHPSGGRAEQVLRGLQDTYLWVARERENALLGARILFDHQDSTLPSLLWMQHLKIEAGASLAVERVTLTPGYMFERFDDRPMAGMHERHQYALLEALRPLGQQQRWFMSARYEHEYRTPNAITREADRQLAIVDLGYEFAPGARVAFEDAVAHDNLGDPTIRSLDVSVRMSY